MEEDARRRWPRDARRTIFGIRAPTASDGGGTVKEFGTAWGLRGHHRSGTRTPSERGGVGDVHGEIEEASGQKISEFFILFRCKTCRFGVNGYSQYIRRDTGMVAMDRRWHGAGVVRVEGLRAALLGVRKRYCR